MISLNPELRKLKSFGTDGEPELIKAFNVCFPQATHLRCTNHLRQNIKDKLRSLSISQSVSSEFLADIFGIQKGRKFEHGLIDANSEASFDKSLEHLKHRWNNLEKSCTSSSTDPQFYLWFIKYKAADIKSCVLPSVRAKAGSDPTRKFTTNMSESINHVIKQEVAWKESKLPVLIEHLKAVVCQHIEELQKAVIGRGEWRFKSLYRHFQVPQAIWFSKTAEFKERHIKKVQSAEVKGHDPASHASDNSTLSVPFENCGLPNIAESTLSNIWSKATKLVKSNSDILNAPWLTDAKARLVKSTSSPHPHVVTTSKSNKNLYCCDEKCPMFAGFSICSHVVAVAEFNGDLRSFLDAARKCAPNLTAIANHGLPKGAGRKGGAIKRKRKAPVPVESRSVRPRLVGTSLLPEDNGQLQSSTTVTPTQDAASLGVLGTDDFDLDKLLETCTEVQSLPVQSPLTPLPSDNATSSVAFSTLQQPCVSLPSITQGQLVLGSGVNLNISPPPVLQSLPVVSNIGNPTAGHTANKKSKPFTLKLRTKEIKICQSCCKDYEGENDTLGLVVAHLERRLISNPTTGTQFWGRESNSHYHANMMCLKKVSVFF